MLAVQCLILVMIAFDRRRFDIHTSAKATCKRMCRQPYKQSCFRCLEVTITCIGFHASLFVHRRVNYTGVMRNVTVGVKVISNTKVILRLRLLVHVDEYDDFIAGIRR